MNVGAGATLEHVGEVLAAKAGTRLGDNLVFPQQFGGNLSGEPRLLRRVDGHRQNAVVLDRRGRAETGRSATDAVPQATLNQVLNFRTQRAGSADKQNFLGNNGESPLGIPALHGAETDRRRIERIDIAADDAMSGDNHVTCDKHRIDGSMRSNAAMAALTADADADAVSRCHYRTTGDGHHTLRKSGPIVEREDLLGRESLEEPILDHCQAAPAALLARLKDQKDISVE